jgi:hypothetical protein
MKRCWIWPVSLITFTSCMLSGCLEPSRVGEDELAEVETTVEPSIAGPKIEFESVVHDFGEVGPGTKQKCELPFTNAGDSLLVIKQVQSCCGVVASLDKNLKEYRPGESGVVKVDYRPSRRPGPISKRFYVHSNDWAEPKVTLVLKATIVPKVNWEPERLKLSLEQENAGCPRIVLDSRDNQPFAITAFQSTADCITANYDSSVRATKFILEPKVDIEKLRENQRGRVNISLTHPEWDTVTIFYDVIPRFSTRPSIITVLNAEPQKPVRRKVEVLNNYGEDFEIESTSSKNGSIKALGQKKISNGYELDLQITPPPAERRLTVFTDVFSIQIRGGDKLAVTCRGFYVRD